MLDDNVGYCPISRGEMKIPIRKIRLQICFPRLGFCKASLALFDASGFTVSNGCVDFRIDLATKWNESTGERGREGV